MIESSNTHYMFLKIISMIVIDQMLASPPPNSYIETLVPNETLEIVPIRK